MRFPSLAPLAAVALLVGMAPLAAAQSSSSSSFTPDTPPSESTPSTSFVTSLPKDLKVNDPSCVPTGTVTEPVVLLHGTTDNSGSWATAIPELQKHGMCVWTFDYGADDVSFPNAIPSLKAIAPLDQAADEVEQLIDRVLQETGAPKVALVGFSQGGLHTKTFMERAGKRDKVTRVATIGAPFHGTTLAGMSDFLRPIVAAVPGLAHFLVSSAAVDQLRDSAFIQELNALPDTAAGISYTSIYSPGDTTVTPNETSKLTAVPGADVANVDLGAVCGVSPQHPSLPRTEAAIAQIIWSLERGVGEAPSSAHCTL